MRREKLPEEQIEKLHKLWDETDLTVVELSERFNISKAAVAGYAYRRNWKQRYKVKSKCQLIK